MKTYTAAAAKKDKKMTARCATCGDRAAWGRHPACKRSRGCLVITASSAGGSPVDDAVDE